MPVSYAGGILEQKEKNKKEMKERIFRILGITQKNSGERNAVNEKNLAILTQFNKDFLVPVILKENREFINFMEGVSEFTENQIAKENGTVFIGSIKKRIGKDDYFYKFSVLRTPDENYTVSFSLVKDELKSYLLNYDTISFSTYKDFPKNQPRLIIAVEKAFSKSNISVNYYGTDSETEKSDWLAKDFASFNNQRYYHSVIAKDDKYQEFKIQEFSSYDKFVDLNLISGVKVKGKRIFDKEGYDLSYEDINYILRILNNAGDFAKQPFSERIK